MALCRCAPLRIQHAAVARGDWRSIFLNLEQVRYGGGQTGTAQLVLELPRHAFAKGWEHGRSVTFGVYGKGPFTGLWRQTLTHSNTIRLLN